MNTPRLPVSPPPRKRQLRVFERRFLLMAGDTLAVLLAVLLALTIWVIVDGRGLGIRFVAARSYWFPILASLWLLLAHSNDFYSLRVSARIDATLMRLVQVTLQLWVLYLIIFFSRRATHFPGCLSCITECSRSCSSPPGGWYGPCCSPGSG
jgi:hypothetical protein